MAIHSGSYCHCIVARYLCFILNHLHFQGFISSIDLLDYFNIRFQYYQYMDRTFNIKMVIDEMVILQDQYFIQKSTNPNQCLRKYIKYYGI